MDGHPDMNGHTETPPAHASLRGLAACLAALEQEAMALRQPLAAHFIAAAALALDPPQAAQNPAALPTQDVPR